MDGDSSIEFDMFEDIRRNIVLVLISEGHQRLVAEKIALYIVQGVRDVPKLMTTLAEPGTHTQAEQLVAIRAILDNASILERGRSLLLGLNQDDEA